jgi:hypothetical protein
MKRVRVNQEYIFYPNLLDKVDGRTGIVPGTIVKVKNYYGCPPANTMNHCYVEVDGEFGGLVHVNSLYTFADRQLVIDAIKADIAKKEVR